MPLNFLWVILSVLFGLGVYHFETPKVEALNIEGVEMQESLAGLRTSVNAIAGRLDDLAMVCESYHIKELLESVDAANLNLIAIEKKKRKN